MAKDFFKILFEDEGLVKFYSKSKGLLIPLLYGRNSKFVISSFTAP